MSDNDIRISDVKFFSFSFSFYRIKHIFRTFNTIRLQAPSKLLELVSTGKPIINFYHHEDSGYHIVEKYPLGINVSCKLSVKTIVEKLKLFIKENAKKRLSYTQICDYYPDYLFENQLPIVKKVITGDI